MKLKIELMLIIIIFPLKVLLALEAGAGLATINPTTTQFLAGFSNFRLSEGQHDDLFARCLILKEGNETIVLVVLDLIGLFRPDCLSFISDIRNYNRQWSDYLNLTPLNIFIISTHNHQGPDTLGLFGPYPLVSGVDPEYMEIVREGVISAYKNAYQNLRRAKIRFANAILGREFNADLREPIVINEEVPIMQIADLEGNVIATLENWASHPEVLWGENTIITADYPGYYYKCIEEHFGGIGIHISGDLGGLLTPETHGSHTWTDAEMVGCEVLAYKVIEALNENVTPWQENVEIKIHKKIIYIPLTNGEFKLLFELGVINRETYDNKVRTEVNYIEIGEARIFTIPGELFPESGMRLKELSNRPYEFIWGLTNDELGYIVPYDQYNPTKYEEGRSIGPEFDPIVYSAFHEIITGKPYPWGTEDEGENGPCFIATATFGSDSTFEVRTLRLFRDRILNRSSLGKALVRFYYKYSPSLADYIKQYPILRLMTCFILTPLAYFISLFLNYKILALFSLIPVLALIGSGIAKRKGLLKIKGLCR